MNIAEEGISDVEDRIMEITQTEQQTETKRKKTHKINIRDLWDNTKWGNLCIKGIPGEEKEKGIENIFGEIMGENCPN